MYQSWYIGNFNNQYGGDWAKEVGQKIPNGYGLYDMQGNLTELTMDWDGCQYPQSTVDPYCSRTSGNLNNINQSLEHKVLKGGAWFDAPIFLLLDYRDFVRHYSNGNYYSQGFRLALTANP